MANKCVWKMHSTILQQASETDVKSKKQSLNIIKITLQALIDTFYRLKNK